MLKKINNLIIFLPQIDMNEEWEPITDIVAYGIRPNCYYISNYGRVFSAVTNRLMEPTVANTGYYVISIGKSDGTRTVITIHRALMLTFNYILGCEDLQVNHIDGVKTNNMIYNLEWVTIAENVQHASKNGLLLTGEAASWTKVTDIQVHTICQLYIQGYGITEISKIIGCGVDSVFNIVHKNNRTDISNMYNIVLRPRGFTDEEVNFMCETFTDHVFNSSYKIICERLKIDDTENARKTIRRIYNKKTYNHITSNYDY